MLIALLASGAAASSSVDVAASTSCDAALPTGDPCSLAQAGTLRVVCASQCDLVAQGHARVNDNMPLARVATTLRMPLIGSAAVSCVAAGIGVTECPFDLSFPLFLQSGACRDASVSTLYERTPVGPVRVARDFTVCRGAGVEHVITPK